MQFLFPRTHKSMHNHWHFLTIGGAAFRHEVYGSPLWVQVTYQIYEDYCKERGKPLAPGL